MVAFIKRRKDFRTYAAAEVVSWDAPLASIEDDVGTIVLYGTDVTRGSEGDFLIMDRHIWLIEQVAKIFDSKWHTLDKVWLFLKISAESISS